MSNLNFPNIAQDGTDQTGITPPAGSTGIRGWLSGLYGLFNTGAARTRITDGTNNAAIPTSAPASDTGQAGLAVRVISQLNAAPIPAGTNLIGNVRLSDGTNTATTTTVSTKQALDVNVIQSVGSQLPSGVDNTTVFNPGTSLISPQGAVYNDGIISATSGDVVGLRATQFRGLHTNLRTAAGVEIGTAASPLVANIQGQAGTAVNGSLTAAGTSVTGVANTVSAINAAVAAAGNFTIRVSGTYSATFNFEATDDGGTTWFAITGGRNDGTGADSVTSALVNVVQSWDFSSPGYTHARVRCSAFVSGSATVRITPGGFLYEPVPIVLQEQIIKGTQNVRGVTTQDLKDAGRVWCGWSANGVVGVAAVTAFSFAQQKGNASVAAISSIAPTTNKRLRLQTLTLSFTSSSTTANAALIQLRYNAGGVATTASPVMLTFRLAFPTGTLSANQGQGIIHVPFPDGFEIAGTDQIMLTHTEAAANGLLDCSLTGYEY